MEWAKGLIEKCSSTEAAIIIISLFALYLMFKLLVKAYRLIETFSESETETAKTLSALKILIEMYVRDRRNDQ